MCSAQRNIMRLACRARYAVEVEGVFLVRYQRRRYIRRLIIEGVPPVGACPLSSMRRRILRDLVSTCLESQSLRDEEDAL